MSLAFSAMEYARKRHRHQVCKYTGDPYFCHLAEVAGLVGTVFGSGSVLATAWLHDTREDTGTTEKFLRKAFGDDVANGVMLLSNLETGNRAERKAAARIRLSSAPGWVQTIKCADLISNTSSIVKHDPKFAVTYLEEAGLLLEVLTKADHRLLAMTRRQVQGVSA